jgi:hypothetical protein
MHCWAALRLPARLDVEQSAKLLGMATHDIPVLVSTGMLRPLGEPAQNSPKLFPAVEIIRLAGDRDWLHKATKKIQQYWKIQNNKRTRGVHFDPLIEGQP